MKRTVTLAFAVLAFCLFGLHAQAHHFHHKHMRHAHPVRVIVIERLPAPVCRYAPRYKETGLRWVCSCNRTVMPYESWSSMCGLP